MRLSFFCTFIIVFAFSNIYAQSWRVMNDSAVSNKTRRNFDKAIDYFLQAKKALPADSLVSETSFRLDTAIANTYYLSKSQFAEAEPYYIEAIKTVRIKNGNNSLAYAAVENLLGQVTYFLRKYIEAEKYYLEAMRIWELIVGKNSREYSGGCNALGVLFNDQDRFDEAEKWHTEAKNIRINLFTKESAQYAQSTNNLAAIYWKTGKFEKAEPLAREAKELRSRLPNAKTAYAISCVNLANIYRDMGKYAQAEENYLEAKKIREEIFTKNHNDYALSCDILADLYYYMKQYDKAEALYLEAKAIREKIFPSREYFYAQSCSSLSALYTAMENYSRAEALALEANSIWEQLGEAVAGDLAISNNNLGSLYFSSGKYDKAENFFMKARQRWIASLGEDHPYVTSSSLSLARVYWMKNEIQKANEYYINAFEKQVKQASHIFSFTSEEEKEQYLKNVADTEDEYQSFYFTKLRTGSDGQPYRISLQKRSEILFSARAMRQSVFESNNDSLNKRYDEWTAIKKQIAFLYSKGDGAPKEYLKQLIRKADELEKELVRQTGGFKAGAQTTNWKEIRDNLKNGEAAIEFIEFAYFNGQRYTDSIYYAALLLKKDSPEPEYIELFERRKIDSILMKSSATRQGLGTFYSRGVIVEVDSSAGSANELIWKPLRQKLNEISTIYFAPAGLLHRISFAAIQIDSLNKLVDNYRLVQLSTTAAVISGAKEVINPSDKIILFGAVLYSQDPAKAKPANKSLNAAERDGFEYLPGTEAEVTQIADKGKNKFKLQVIKGWQAKEDSVKKLNGKNSPAILHVATHGFFFDDPELKMKKATALRITGGNVFQFSENPLFRSGLLFAGANDTWKGKHVDSTYDDGILTAYELSNLYFPNTRLAVLSACETALGDIKGSEGVYGLQRALKIAGVQNLVMSLWKVPDVETSEFMNEFYDGIFSGMAVDNAFYKAQKAMRVKYKSATDKWAAWILVR